MGKFKKQEIEVSPHLMKKLFEYVKDAKITTADFDWIIHNLVWMSEADDLLTVEEFEQITKKPMVM